MVEEIWNLRKEVRGYEKTTEMVRWMLTPKDRESIRQLGEVDAK